MIKAEIKNGNISVTGASVGPNKKSEATAEVIELCSSILEGFIKGTCKKGHERKMLLNLLAAIEMDTDLRSDK